MVQNKMVALLKPFLLGVSVGKWALERHVTCHCRDLFASPGASTPGQRPTGIQSSHQPSQ